MATHHVAPTPLPYTHSFRISVTLSRDKATITDVKRVAMRALASAPGIPADGQSGMWFELRGEDGKVLYHTPLRTPQLDSLEVFDDPKTGGIRRVKNTQPEAKFDLIVPDLPNATELALYGTHDTARKHRPSERLLHLSLQELRRVATGRSN